MEVMNNQHDLTLQAVLMLGQRLGALEEKVTEIHQTVMAHRVEGLKKGGVEYRGYAFRAAARVLTDHEIKRVRQELASMSLLRHRGGN